MGPVVDPVVGQTCQETEQETEQTRTQDAEQRKRTWDENRPKLPAEGINHT